MLKHRRIQLITVAFTAFTDLLDFGIAIPLFGELFLASSSRFFPDGTTDGMKYFLFGLLMASYSIAQFFMAPLLGQLSDKHGRKIILKVTIFGTVISRLLFLVAIYTQNLPLAFISRLIDGGTGGNTAVAVAAVSDISEEKKKARNISFVYVAMALGAISGPIISGLLHSVDLGNKFIAPFAFSALVSFINLVTINFIFNESLKKPDLSLIIKPLSTVKDMLKVFYDHKFKNLFLSLTIFLVAYNIVSQLFPIYMVKTYDLDVATVSGLFFLLAVSIVISQAVTFNYLHKLLPAREIIKKILPAISICVLLLMFYHIPGVGPNVLILTLVVMVFAMLYALVLPAFSVVFTEEAGKTGHGHSLGIVSSAQAFASSVGPLLGGFLVGIFYELPIVVCAILILLSLKLFKVWEKE